MKTTIPDTLLNDPAVQPASMKAEGRRLKEQTDKTLPAQADYARAYSVYLLGEGPFPVSHDFGISIEIADLLRRQCRSMAHKQLDAQKPAVSFTEAESRKHAEDLRCIAADLCELGVRDSERTLRILAQKFDEWRKEE